MVLHEITYVFILLSVIYPFFSLL